MVVSGDRVQRVLGREGDGVGLLGGRGRDGGCAGERAGGGLVHKGRGSRGADKCLQHASIGEHWQRSPTGAAPSRAAPLGTGPGVGREMGASTQGNPIGNGSQFTPGSSIMETQMLKKRDIGRGKERELLKGSGGGNEAASIVSAAPSGVDGGDFR